MYKYSTKILFIFVLINIYNLVDNIYIYIYNQRQQEGHAKRRNATGQGGQTESRPTP